MFQCPPERQMLSSCGNQTRTLNYKWLTLPHYMLVIQSRWVRGLFNFLKLQYYYSMSRKSDWVCAGDNKNVIDRLCWALLMKQLVIQHRKSVRDRGRVWFIPTSNKISHTNYLPHQRQTCLEGIGATTLKPSGENTVILLHMSLLMFVGYLLPVMVKRSNTPGRSPIRNRRL